MSATPNVFVMLASNFKESIYNVCGRHFPENVPSSIEKTGPNVRAKGDFIARAGARLGEVFAVKFDDFRILKWFRWIKEEGLESHFDEKVM